MPSKKVRAKLKKQNKESDENNLSRNKTQSMMSIANKVKPMYDKLNEIRDECVQKFAHMLEFINKTELSLSEIKEIETKMKYKASDDAYIESNRTLIKNLPQQTISDLKSIGSLWNESKNNPYAYTKLDELHVQITPVFLKVHMELAGQWINYIKSYKNFQNLVISMGELISPVTEKFTNQTNSIPIEESNNEPSTTISTEESATEPSIDKTE